MSDCLIMRAINFAKQSHAGQLRKYTNRPYVEHCMRVAGRTSLFDGANEHHIAAAWLHDVAEDCDVSPEQILEQFGIVVASLVRQLTNPSRQHPEMRRAERKAMDREHLRHVQYWAKIIKFVDRIDNLKEMAGAEDDFKILYSRESIMLADALNNERGREPLDSLYREMCETAMDFCSALPPRCEP